MKSIALCGFMGCGKTTVANALKDLLKCEHIDTDKYIEDTQNMSINEIFKTKGEEHFRDLEYKAISKLSKTDNCILALGGGAVTFTRNINALKENGCKIVFLDTDLSIIKERLQNDTTRPLLKSNDIEKLYNNRYEIYDTICDVKIKCKNESADVIAQEIVNNLKKA